MTNPFGLVVRMRWWLLGAIYAAAAAALVGLNATEEAREHFMHGFFMFLVVVLAALLTLGWVFFLSGLRWRVRFLVIAAALAPVIAFFSVMRVKEYSGAVVPVFTWRWTPEPDSQLAVPAAAAGAAVDLTATTPQDYPRFLGADGRAAVAGVKLARDWKAQPPRPLWRQPIGAGWSAFAVVGPFAVTQEQRGDLELVTCYEVATGKLCWAHQDKARFAESLGGVGPRATPTVHQGDVYALGATGILNCLRGADGSRLWSHNVLEETGSSNIEWAKSTSPLVVDDLVVVTTGRGGSAAVVAYHKDTGKLAWKAGTDTASYASPVLATLAGRRQIVQVHQHSVTAHDPADGAILWDYPWPGDMAKCSDPIPLSETRILLNAGYGVGCVLLEIRAEGGGLKWSEVWTSKALRPRFTNLVIRDGDAYGLDDGILACMSLKDGRRLWKGGRYDHGQVLLVGDVLLVQAEDGAVVLVEATPDGHRELTRFPALEGKTWNNPVLTGRRLLVRNATEAACYELPVQEPAAVGTAPEKP